MVLQPPEARAVPGADAVADNPVAFGLLARLGAALARPLATFDQRVWSVGSLAPAEIAALAREPAFSAAFERLIAATIYGPDWGLSRQDIADLTTSPAGRLAILLISESLARVEDVALLCAVAAMHRQVLGVTRKEQRNRVRQALGPVLYQIATQEAPVLYQGLAAFGDEARFRRALGESGDDDALRRHLVDFGIDLLLRVASPAAPGLAALFGQRRDRVPEQSASNSGIAIGSKHFERLFFRRVPAWSAIIG